MLWSDHVREDVEAAMEDYSGSLPDNEDEREVLVESVVTLHVTILSEDMIATCPIG